jgi:hypothetical protein
LKLVLVRSHPLAENRRRFSLKTSQWEPDKITIMRTGLKLLTPSDNRPVKTAQVLTWHAIWKLDQFSHFGLDRLGLSCTSHLILHPLLDVVRKAMKYWDSAILLNKGMKYWDSAVIGAPSLQASLMDIHHYTSLRSILEDDFVSSTSRIRIVFVQARGQGYGWLLGHLSVHFTSHILLSSQHCVFTSVWFNPWHLVFSHVNVDTSWTYLACI